ncbi:MAG: ArsA family ATPase [Chloroflexota bacterium]|nr:ArsA family ATPase [Anaerolineales bacterium]
MNNSLKQLMSPNGKPKYLFFGGKGGVGKTSVSTATAVWFADHGYETTIVSTDPTVSLSTMFHQEIRGDHVAPIHQVPNLCGLNINPTDAKGVFQSRLNSLMGQVNVAFGNDVVSTPCAEEMASFDQFVGFLESPQSEVIVFDTAPTGKTLRELAMPFDWAGYMEKQIKDGKELARIMNMDESALDSLNSDKRRYDRAMSVLQDSKTTVFSLVLLPERLPVEETQSAMTGLEKLGISVQALVINQSIEPEVIEGNRFLQSRADLQFRYQTEIDKRFTSLARTRLPLLDHDVSDLESLRKIGQLLYDDSSVKIYS